MFDGFSRTAMLRITPEQVLNRQAIASQDDEAPLR